MGLIKVDEVVRNCIADFGYTDTRKYNRILDQVVRGFEQLEIWVIPYISTVILPIRNNMTVVLPKDFVYYTKIGISYKGKIYTLGLNEDIAGQTCGCSSAIEAQNVIINSAPISEYYTFYNVSNDEFGRTDEVYGLAAGRNSFGFYKVDKKQGVVILNTSSFCDDFSKLYLEYKGNMAINGLTHVPSEARETLITWAGSKMFHGTPRGDRYERQYQMNYNRLKSLYLTNTKEEYEDQFLKAVKSTPKR